MHSLGTRITVLTLLAVILSLSVVAVMSVVAIQDLGTNTSEQILYLLCENGEKNLDACFEKIEQSANSIAAYVEYDLAGMPSEQLSDHLDRMESFFEKTAGNTSDILTYYYRIDPEYSQTESGFWYVRQDDESFTEHVVTDISQYDTSDQSSLVWFTVPKATGRSTWLSPYVTETLNVYVLSYNVPIYQGNVFVGVVGIEIDYRTIANIVSNITLFESGYAFVNDDQGTIIFHPKLDPEDYTGGEHPTVPEGLVNESRSIQYTYEGVKKIACWLPLVNGMRLNVCVPVSEISAESERLVTRMITVSILLILVVALASWLMIHTITRPLRKLTEAAKQVESGNYDVSVDYRGDDEIGQLAGTFNHLTAHLRNYILDLSNSAFTDALTSVRNKRSFDIYMRDLQSKIQDPDTDLRFAVVMFDCDNLKAVNDSVGHEKGDTYLQVSSAYICRVFSHSPVFRIGGDEFVAILLNEDYRDREALMKSFVEGGTEVSGSLDDFRGIIRISLGMSEYDPETDRFAEDVVHRADQKMYANKREHKSAMLQNLFDS